MAKRHTAWRYLRYLLCTAALPLLLAGPDALHGGAAAWAQDGVAEPASAAGPSSAPAAASSATPATTPASTSSAASLPAGAQPPASGPASASLAAASPLQPLRVPRITGRLHAAQLGVVINTADPYSVAVGEYYVKRRHLRPAQVLRLELPLRDALTPDEFEQFRIHLNQFFGPSTQALALAWRAPYAVACNSITGALALGFDHALCAQTCNRSRPSPYFNSPSATPLASHGFRPSMLLAAGSVAQARQLVDRGVAADGAAVLRGAPPALALYVTTNDAARNVRAPLYPPTGALAQAGIEVLQVPLRDMSHRRNLMVLQTGVERAPALDTLDWRPGALADDLTSNGGLLTQPAGQGQTTAVDWIDAGATASYGTVSEPCNHVQKFPHPQVLLLHYLQGATALEAYWKSVLWPQQGVFVGDPLAAPYARDVHPGGARTSASDSAASSP